MLPRAGARRSDAPAGAGAYHNVRQVSEGVWPKVPRLCNVSYTLKKGVVKVRAMTLLATLALTVGTQVAPNGHDIKSPITCTPISNPISVSSAKTQPLHLLDTESQSEVGIQCSAQRIFPARLYVSGSSTRINLSRFTVKKGSAKYETGGQAWSIDKDHAEHGGSTWKLRDQNGNRQASLRENGDIIWKNGPRMSPYGAEESFVELITQQTPFTEPKE